MFENINLDSITPYIDNILSLTISYIPKVGLAVITLLIGFKIVGFAQRLFKKFMEVQELDPMLESFLSSLVGGLLKILIFVSAAGILGVKTDSFVAMLAAAGFAIGMALSGTLQNFASGLMILAFKPFKQGDYVEVGGHAGFIEESQIFNTIILTADKKTIIMPNSEITSSSLVNYSEQAIRRVDMEIGIGYNDDITLAKNLLREIAESDTRVKHDKQIRTGVRTLGDNAVILAFRFYVESADYWEVWFDITEKIKITFDEKGVSFPFPQRDVHHYNETSSIDLRK